MKISLKNKNEIKIMTRACRKLAQVMDRLLAAAEPGVSLASLENLAQKEIARHKGRPSFAMVSGYHWATCINLNHGVVHGVPDQTKIKPGDLVSIDVGLFEKGFHSDMARSILISTRDSEKEKFLRAGQEVFKLVLNQVKPGRRLGHLSQAIEEGLRARGYWPVYNLTGHGIGRQLHEPPSIPCFLDKPVSETPLLQAGMTLAIEVIYTAQETSLVVAPDGWTVETADQSWGGLYENTILVTRRGAQILTAGKSGLN